MAVRAIFTSREKMFFIDFYLCCASLYAPSALEFHDEGIGISVSYGLEGLACFVHGGIFAHVILVCASVKLARHSGEAAIAAVVGICGLVAHRELNLVCCLRTLLGLRRLRLLLCCLTLALSRRGLLTGRATLLL